MIPQMVCRIEWEEECSTSNKKIGEKVVYQKKCENREVKVCKWVQFFHPQYPSLGISGGADKYEECEKVTKKFCKDVPEKEDVMADVETCVNTPKQVCKEGMLRKWRESCDRIKPGSSQSDTSDTGSVMPRKPKSDDPSTVKMDDSITEEADDSATAETVDLTPAEVVDATTDEVVDSTTAEAVDPTQDDVVNPTTVNPK